MTCFHHICPDGGIGRRAGLKHQCRKASRFEPESGYKIKAKVLSSILWLFCFAGGSCARKQHAIQNIPRRGTVIISP